MIFIPPIKSQGIKTKLVEWIRENTEEIDYDRWVEPFMGTGVVAFNIRPKRALLCDSNPYLIKFYQEIKEQKITSIRVRHFLTEEGEKLLKSNGEYYYELRDRFNKNRDSLDFLFLSRACFNGMMRFNKKGEFNVPFCKKPQRFAPSLITKIVNQVKNISQIILSGDYTFINQDFQDTLKTINSRDLVYLDPPYLNRHTDYFNSWSEEQEKLLNQGIKESQSKYLLSTWLSNKYRTNEYIFSAWKEHYIVTKEHFYYVGGKESNRNAVYEAIISNLNLKNSVTISEMKHLIINNESLVTFNPKKSLTSEQLVLNF
jgi:DNA adenine methylase